MAEIERPRTLAENDRVLWGMIDRVQAMRDRKSGHTLDQIREARDEIEEFVTAHYGEGDQAVRLRQLGAIPVRYLEEVTTSEDSPTIEEKDPEDEEITSEDELESLIEDIGSALLEQGHQFSRDQVLEYIQSMPFSTLAHVAHLRITNPRDVSLDYTIDVEHARMILVRDMQYEHDEEGRLYPPGHLPEKTTPPETPKQIPSPEEPGMVRPEDMPQGEWLEKVRGAVAQRKERLNQSMLKGYIATTEKARDLAGNFWRRRRERSKLEKADDWFNRTALGLSALLLLSMNESLRNEVYSWIAPAASLPPTPELPPAIDPGALPQLSPDAPDLTPGLTQAPPPTEAAPQPNPTPTDPGPLPDLPPAPPELPPKDPPTSFEVESRPDEYIAPISAGSLDTSMPIPALVAKNGFSGLFQLPQFQARFDMIPKDALSKLPLVLHDVFSDAKLWTQLVPSALDVNVFPNSGNINLSVLHSPEVVEAIERKAKIYKKLSETLAANGGFGALISK